MFFIYANDKLIYRPMDQSLVLLEPKLNLEMGKAGSLEFNILPSHPYFNQIQQLTTAVRVTMDEKEIFRGRVLTNTLNFDTSRSIYCEGALSYLVDSVQKARAFNGKLHDFFSFVISQHNALVEEEKQFYVGEITVENRDMKIAGKNEENLNVGNIDYQQIVINSIVDNWSNTLDYLESTVISYAGGYLRARYEDGKAYIDLLQEYGGTATQEIELGSNLLELEQEISAEDLFTVLIPLGDDNLTIETVNNFSDEIADADAVAKYGRIVRTQTFSNVRSPSTLMENAQRYLASKVNIPMTLTVKAVDLHLLNPNIRAIYLGDRVHITSGAHGLLEYLTCTQIEYDIASPGNNTYTFGNPKQTLTERYKEDWRQQSYSQSVGESGGVASGGGALGWHLLGKTEEAKEEAEEAKEDAEKADEKAEEAKEEAKKIKQVLYDAGINVDDATGLISLQSLRKDLDEKGRLIETNAANISMLQDETGSRIDMLVSRTDAQDQELDDISGRLSLYILNNQSVLEAKADKVTVDASVVEINSDLLKLNTRIDSLTASYANIDKLVSQRIDAKLGAADIIIAKNIMVSNQLTFMNQQVSTWNHSHRLYENADGTITLGYATSNGGEYQSFKIADTKAYKEGVSAAVNAVSVSFGLDSKAINSDPDAIKFQSGSKSLSFPIQAQLYKDRNKTEALGDPITARASISAELAMKAVTIADIFETEDSVQQYDSDKQTITTNVTAKTSENVTGSRNITVSARPAYNRGYNTGGASATVDLNSARVVALGNHREEEAGTTVNHFTEINVFASPVYTDTNGGVHVGTEQQLFTNHKVQANAVWDAGVNSVAIVKSKIQNGSTVYPYDTDSSKSRALVTVPVTVEATNGATQSADLSVDVGKVWDKSMKNVDLYESSAAITGFTAPTEDGSGNYISTVSGSVKLTSTAASGGRYDSAAKSFSIEDVDVSVVYNAGKSAGRNVIDITALGIASYGTSSSPARLGTTSLPNANVRYDSTENVLRGRVSISLDNNLTRTAVVEMDATRAINSVTVPNANIVQTSNGAIGYPYGSDSTKSRYSITVPVTATASNQNSGANTLTVNAGAVWNQSIREAAVTNLAVTGFTTPQPSGNTYVSTISGTYSTTGTGSEGTAVTSTSKNFSIPGVDVGTVYTAGRGSVAASGITQASYSTTVDISAIPVIENAYFRAVNGDNKLLQARVTIALDNGTSKTQLIQVQAYRAYDAGLQAATVSENNVGFTFGSPQRSGENWVSSVGLSLYTTGLLSDGETTWTNPVAKTMTLPGVNVSSVYNSVTVSSITRDTDRSTSYDNATYTYTIPVKATLSNGNVGPLGSNDQLNGSIELNAAAKIQEAWNNGGATAAVNSLAIVSRQNHVTETDETSGTTNHFVEVTASVVPKYTNFSGTAVNKASQNIYTASNPHRVQANKVWSDGVDSVTVPVNNIIQNGSVTYPYKTDSTKSKYIITVPVKATASNGNYGTKSLTSVDVQEVYETGVLEGSTSGSSSGKAYITVTGLGRKIAGSGDPDTNGDGYVDDQYQSSSHNTIVAIQAQRYDSETKTVLNTVTGSLTVSGLNAYTDGHTDGVADGKALIEIRNLGRQTQSGSTTPVDATYAKSTKNYSIPIQAQRYDTGSGTTLSTSTGSINVSGLEAYNHGYDTGLQATTIAQPAANKITFSAPRQSGINHYSNATLLLSTTGTLSDGTPWTNGTEQTITVNNVNVSTIANAVTIDSIARDTSRTAQISETNETYLIPVTATASNSNTGPTGATLNVWDVYAAGKTAGAGQVVQRSAVSAYPSTPTYVAANSTYNYPHYRFKTYARYDDGTVSGALPYSASEEFVRVDASSAWNAGAGTAYIQPSELTVSALGSDITTPTANTYRAPITIYGYARGLNADGSSVKNATQYSRSTVADVTSVYKAVNISNASMQPLSTTADEDLTVLSTFTSYTKYENNEIEARLKIDLDNRNSKVYALKIPTPTSLVPKRSAVSATISSTYRQAGTDNLDYVHYNLVPTVTYDDGTNSAVLDAVVLDVTTPWTNGNTTGAANARPRDIVAGSGSMTWDGTTLSIPLKATANTSTYDYSETYTIGASALSVIGLGESVTKVPVRAKTGSTHYTSPVITTDSTTGVATFKTRPKYELTMQGIYSDGTMTDELYADAAKTQKLTLWLDDTTQSGYNAGARTAKATGIELGDWLNDPQINDHDGTYWQTLSFIKATATGSTFAGGTVTGTEYYRSNYQIDVTRAYEAGRKNGTGQQVIDVTGVDVHQLDYPVASSNVVNRCYYDAEANTLTGYFEITPKSNSASLASYNQYIVMSAQSALENAPKGSKTIPVISSVVKGANTSVQFYTNDDTWAAIWGGTPDYEDYIRVYTRVNYIYINAYGNRVNGFTQNQNTVLDLKKSEVVSGLSDNSGWYSLNSVSQTGNVSKEDATFKVPISINYTNYYKSNQTTTTVLDLPKSKIDPFYANQEVADAFIDEILQNSSPVTKFYDYTHLEDRFTIPVIVSETVNGEPKYTPSTVNVSKSKFDSFYQIDLSRVTLGDLTFGYDGDNMGTITVGSMDDGTGRACFNIPSHIDYSIDSTSATANKQLKVPKGWFDSYYRSSTSTREPTGVVQRTNLATGEPMAITWSGTTGSAPVRVTTSDSNTYYDYTLTLTDSGRTSPEVQSINRENWVNDAADSMLSARILDMSQTLYNANAGANAILTGTFSATLNDGSTTKFHAGIHTGKVYAAWAPNNATANANGTVRTGQYGSKILPITIYVYNSYSQQIASYNTEVSFVG